MADTPFQFHAPLRFFEKANAPKGRKMRIAGVVSTEKMDRQEETMMQRGLNFDYFKSDGWFNDNHKKGPDAILGHPDGEPRIFNAGQRLPDGETAEHNCTWAEGYLLDTPRGRATWENGKALQGSGRSLGFSIEGNVTGRAGFNNKVVTAAIVRNIAITECPVGYGTGLVTLAKSLVAANDEYEADDEAEKALTMGSDASPAATQGPKTGEGAGRLISPQSLEKALAEDEEEDLAEDEEEVDLEEDGEEDEEEGEPLSKSAVFLQIEARFPSKGIDFAERATSALFTLNNEHIMHSDLEKALAGLSDVIEAENPQSRHRALMAKSLTGDCTPEENDELIKNLRGGGYGIQADLDEALEPDDVMSKALDVTPILQGQHDGIVAGFGVLGQRLEKSEAQSHEFRCALGGTLMEMAKSLSAMQATINTLGGKPAGEVLSKSAVGASDAPAPVAAPQERGLGNEAPAGDFLSKAQVFDALQGMMEGSKERGFKALCGEDITQATSKYESTGKMSKSMQDEVADFVRNQRA